MDDAKMFKIYLYKYMQIDFYYITFKISIFIENVDTNLF